MNPQQSQFELFPAENRRNNTAGKGQYYLGPVTLSFEKVLFLSLFVFLFFLLSFSMGVERGKKITKFPSIVKKENAQTTPLFSAQVQEVSSIEKVAFSPEDTQDVKQSNKEQIQFSGKENTGIIEAVNVFENAYTIQVASFKQSRYAKKEADILKQKGYDIFVINKGDHAIVCVGKFFEKQEAVSTQKKLKKQYKDCLVRRL